MSKMLEFSQLLACLKKIPSDKNERNLWNNGFQASQYHFKNLPFPFSFLIHSPFSWIIVSIAIDKFDNDDRKEEKKEEFVCTILLIVLFRRRHAHEEYINWNS